MFACVTVYVAILSFSVMTQLEGQETWNEFRDLDTEADQLLYKYETEQAKEIRHLKQRLSSYRHFIANEKKKIK
jgi:hypothetical protein